LPILPKEAGFLHNLTSPLFEKKEQNLPIVSIITVCLNNAASLEKTIQSVISQSYPNIEYIIIDGGSTDATCEVIKKYEPYIKYWVSESDRGISDAFNKGVSQATGDFIAFLNSDDRYLSEQSLQRLVEASPEADVVYGGIKYQRAYKPERFPQQIDDSSYWLRGSIPHQAALTSRKMFDAVGIFDCRLKYTMDYDFYCRGYSLGFRFKALPELITLVGCNGISAREWKKQLDEIYSIQTNMSFPYPRKLFYYWKRLIRMGIYYNLVRLKLLD
jgi:glycosyltransferase involved in cell wall biosynthesis